MWDVLLLLIGAVLGALVRPFQDSFYAPKLQFVFEKDDRKYLVDTIDASGHTFEYLRVGIRNNGWGTAKDVRILVTDLVLQTRGARDLSFDTEVLDLMFANSHEPILDIPRNTYRIVDVCRVQRRLNPELQFLFLKVPNYFPRDLAYGNYEVTVQATAANTKTVSAPVKFEWNGTKISFR